MTRRHTSGTQAGILAVEDDGIVARDLERSLEDLGYEVVGVAASAEEAVRRIREREPDLVLMDIRLRGDTDGVEAASFIEEELGIPVVYLTAYADRETLRRVTRSRLYGFVVKPFDARELQTAVELALHRHRAERSRKEHERWYERILERVQDVVAVLDPGGGVEYVNPAVERVLGYAPDELVGRTVLAFVHPDDREAFGPGQVDALWEPGQSLEEEVRVRTSEGDWRILHLTGQVYPPRATEDEPRLVVNARDVTERRSEQRRLDATGKRYRLLFEESVSGAFQATTDGRYLDANRALLDILGYDSVEELIGEPMSGTFRPEDLDSVLDRLDAEGSVDSTEVRVVRPDGAPAHLLLSAGLVRVPDRDEPVIVGTVVDITERKRLEADLEWMAYHDALTGLHNRRALREQAGRFLSLAERQGGRLGLVYLDLHRFKAINDRLGHDAGDTVLAEVADRLKEGARDSDVVARVGGDEFVILLPDVESREGAASAARRFDGVLDEPVLHRGEAIEVTGQLGVAVYPDHGETFDELAAAADRAMYRLKDGLEDSGGHVTLAGEEAPAAADGEEEDAGALREALREGSLLAHYQPIVRGEDGTVVGAEALLRWSRADGRTTPAAEFLPTAERSGLLGRLDEHVLATVDADVDGTALPEGLEWISVNMAASSLSEAPVIERLTALAAKLKERGLGLTVELSERSMGAELRAAEPDLASLHGKGVSLALDGFGSGPSTLTVLSSLPADLVKMDRKGPPAVRRADDRTAAMRGLVGLAQALGARVVLTRVEEVVGHEDRAEFLQGHATGPPGPLSALTPPPSDAAAPA